MRHPGVPQNWKMGSREMSSKMVVVVFGPSLTKKKRFQRFRFSSSGSVPGHPERITWRDSFGEADAWDAKVESSKPFYQSDFFNMFQHTKGDKIITYHCCQKGYRPGKYILGTILLKVIVTVSENIFVWCFCLRVTVSVSKLWITRTTRISFRFRKISAFFNFNRITVTISQKSFWV